MTGRGIDLLGMARGGAVAPAIIRRAQMRAALDDLARDFDVGLTGIVAAALTGTARVFRNAAGFGRISFVFRRIPVGRPFPDIPDHVVEAISVGRECCDRGSAFKSVARQILARKIALPGVRHMVASGRQLIPPREFGVVKAAARREFPFGFSR